MNQIKHLDFIIVGILEILAIVYVIVRVRFRCKKCKKYSAFRYKDRKVIDKNSTSIRTKINTRNNKGEIISTSEQYIPGTRFTYQKTAKCKYCSYCKHKKYTKEYKD
ncbi:hypothetical protein ACWG0P_10890 [Amedibacillus sp. YH-ame6]